MFIRIDPDAWHSAQRTGWDATQDLKKGQVVIANRRAFLIDRVEEMPSAKWPQQYVDLWLKAEMPDAATWRQRPMQVQGFWQTPETDSRAHSAVGPAAHEWDVLPEHYSVCRLCHELPPCRHVHNEAVMSRARRKMAQDMSILPGTCHSCREPVTARQKSFTFPGPNLMRPDLGEDSALFHVRRKCASGLRSYDRRWADDAQGRSRLLECPGRQTRHYDDTVECSEPVCSATGVLRDLVQHRQQVRHHPQGGRVDRGCWCMVGVPS